MGLSRENLWMMCVLSSLIVVAFAITSMFLAGKRDGYKDGDLMKLTKKILKDAIAESLREVEEDPTTLRTATMSTAARQAASRERIKSTKQDKEFTSQEKSIVDQFETFISDLAGAEGVDLMNYRPLLNRVIAILHKTIKPQSTQGEPQ